MGDETYLFLFKRNINISNFHDVFMKKSLSYNIYFRIIEKFLESNTQKIMKFLLMFPSGKNVTGAHVPIR